MSEEAAARFRFCPHCGVAFSGVADRRCFRCPACGFSLWFNASASVSVILVDSFGRILVLVRSKNPGSGLWTLPGGFVEPGEDAGTALRREVFEEIGVALGTLDWVSAFPNRYEYAGVVYPTLDLVFHAVLPNGRDIRLSDESAGYLWLTRSELDLERFAFPSLANAVGLFCAGRMG